MVQKLIRKIEKLYLEFVVGSGEHFNKVYLRLNTSSLFSILVKIQYDRGGLQTHGSSYY